MLQLLVPMLELRQVQVAEHMLGPKQEQPQALKQGHQPDWKQEKRQEKKPAKG